MERYRIWRRVFLEYLNWSLLGSRAVTLSRSRPATSKCTFINICVAKETSCQCFCIRIFFFKKRPDQFGADEFASPGSGHLVELRFYSSAGISPVRLNQQQREEQTDHKEPPEPASVFQRFILEILRFSRM